MDANELRKRYLEFFKSKNHTIIPSASLVPRETDASVLFTTAGMHPLVPYLLGEEHPGGKRVANVQKCVRTGDIDDVGDNRHLTFFEMMGNWSFGDYFKKEAIQWSFEFLTNKEIGLGLDPDRLYITTFKGEDNIPRDEEAIKIWKEVFASVGIETEVADDDEIIKGNIKIIPLGIDDNFWIAGTTGPCGGDTEIFYDMRPEEGKVEGKFSNLVGSFRLLEIWNNVFMEFNKTANGQYQKLEKPNVDTGMGVERTLAVLNNKYTVFETELFAPIFQKLENISNSKYSDNEETKKSFRIIADHIRTSVFIICDGVLPANIGRGYVLRRVIRRAVRYAKLIGINQNFTKELSQVVINIFKDFYPELEQNKNLIFSELEKEENKFRATLENGLKEFYKLNLVSGKDAFDLYQTYGFPFEMTKELAKERGVEIDQNGFETEMQKHQELSRTASAGMFKGGLQSAGEIETKYHTATHLLLAALRIVLGDSVYQKGSNITPERLRLDFSYSDKMTPEQIKQAEDLVNQKIKENLPVIKEEMSLEDAKKANAMGVFESKYDEKVSVYSIGNLATNSSQVFSKEICGGPHVKNTGELGHFKIIKEESVAAGIRRIKGILE